MPQDSQIPILSGFPCTARIIDVRRGYALGIPDLIKRVCQERDGIRSLALPEHRPVVVAHQSALDLLAAMFAAWASGHPAIVSTSKLTADERRNVVAHTGAAAWFDDAKLHIADHQPMRHATSAANSLPLGRDDVALVMLTSGTTGAPKGIVHTVRSIEARLSLNVAYIGEADLTRSLCVLPPFFGHGLIGNCLTPLAGGGTLCLWNSPDIAETSAFGEIVDRFDITFLSSVPSFWKLAMRISRPPQKAPKRVHIGSAPLSFLHWQAIADWCGTKNIFNMFGMTETANWIGGGAYNEAQGRDGYVGKPWGGRYAILSDGGTVEPNGRGEVLAQSPSMMTGYLNAPDKTAESFLDNWLRTGDIGELNTAGELTLIGRIKTEINRAGIKVQPEEIEMLLERHRAVASACAFGVPDPVSGEAIAAAIVLADGVTADQEAIKQWCRERIRPEAVPSHLYFLEELPRNERGKIVRRDVSDALKRAGVIR